MTTFDDREKAFEDRFAHDEALRFRVLARRDKLAGLWAADLLGKTGEVAADYAKTVILADLEHPGDEDIVAKLTADLRGLATESAVRAQLQVAFLEAERQIRDGL